jgi:hypothetical protein
MRERPTTGQRRGVRSAVVALKVVVRRVENGRVGFNQVVMEQQAPPPGVLLVAIDADRGLFVWLRSHDTVASHTVPQAAGYSRAIAAFAVAGPPSFLGDPVFFPKEDIEGWDDIIREQTNTLNREIRELFGIAG